MNLAEILTRERIALDVLCGDWKEAVRAGCGLLLREGCVSTGYADAVIRHHEELGPYMVVAPGIMFAHARPEEGGLEVAISLLRLKQPIAFGSEMNDPVRLVLTLATTDSAAHLTLLEKLMELLSDEADMQRIETAATVEEVGKIIDRYR